MQIEEILSNPPEYVATAKVFDILMAVPKFGRVKAARFLNQCRISQSKTVGGLSERQRDGADRPLQPVAAGTPGLRRHRPVGRRQGNARARAARPRCPSSSSRSRPRRASAATGEEDGREYWFLSDEEFDERLAAGEFLEHVEFPSGHRYGTLRSEIDRIRPTGRMPLLELETEGALDVKDAASRAR